MPAKFNVFLRPQQLNLSSRERALWLQPLQRLLLEHPTRFGQILLGNRVGPWKRSDLREIEVLIAGRVTDRPAQAAYLSILHEAALNWSAHTRKRAPLPLFLSPERSYDNPFSRDFANSACVRNEWISTLSQWVGRLHDVSSEPDTRSLRLAAVLISSIIYGPSQLLDSRQTFRINSHPKLINECANASKNNCIIGRMKLVVADDWREQFIGIIRMQCRP